MNNVLGGQIAPSKAELGATYTFYSDVQFYAKSNCDPLSENSGLNAPSTFTLLKVLDNHTFSTGLTVDRLFVTMQTGELQLYAVYQGRNVGWVGGGSEQGNNEWAAEPREIYFNRTIPQDVPNRYCQ